MTEGRCQICNRRKGLRKNGTVVHHCVGGPRCPGAGYPPIEVDDARLRGYAAEVDAAFTRACQAVRELEERRANYIDPRLIMRRGSLAGLSLRIGRRLKRHREWPQRYRRSHDRQMAKFGYAYAVQPPAYLTAREASS